MATKRKDLEDSKALVVPKSDAKIAASRETKLTEAKSYIDDLLRRLESTVVYLKEDLAEVLLPDSTGDSTDELEDLLDLGPLINYLVTVADRIKSVEDSIAAIRYKLTV